MHVTLLCDKRNVGLTAQNSLVMTLWEIALSIVLMIIAIVICTVISARIYRYGVLMYGQRPGMRQLMKLARVK